VLVVDPNAADGKRTVSAIRRALPDASTVRVQDIKQATRLIFEQGLFTFEPELPRLIFLEPRGIDGQARAFLQRLRARGSTRSVPVVILSRCSRPGEIAQSYLMGARDHVVKPNHLSQYIDEVERVAIAWLQLTRFQADGEHPSADIRT
jgi:CheY-like chemotaxis protein